MGPMSTRSKLGRDEIKWQELLLHFRSVQARHEKARRQALGADTAPYSDFLDADRPGDFSGGSGGNERTGRPVTAGRAPLRRRVTGELPLNPASVISTPGRSGALSPLNPRARGGGPSQNGAGSTFNTGIPLAQQKQRRTSLTRK